MNLGMILHGAAGIGVALAGGKAGKELGKSKVTGNKPWQKILAPAGAVAVAIVYQVLTGSNHPVIDAATGGAEFGVTATGVFSLVKNIKELGKLF